MQSQRNPRLRRIDVVSNSFAGCVADATEEFSRTPEMSFSEIISQPGMLLQQTESTVTFEKLKRPANTHSGGHLNKQVDVVNSDVEFINLKPFSVSNLPDEEFTIHSDSVKFHGISGIFAFPYEVESILSEAMLSRFQIHFSSPIAHANIGLVSRGLVSSPSDIQEIKFYKEGGNSSVGLKTEVSLPQM